MLSFDENSIRTENGSVVMHSWETPVMQEMCKWVCKRGAKADVLEIGFGMGIASDFIQSHRPNSHTICESDPEVLVNLKEWSKDKSNVTIVEGDWYKNLDKFTTYHGILFDTFADMNIEKFKKEIVYTLSKDIGTHFCIWDNMTSDVHPNFKPESTKKLFVEKDTKDSPYVDTDYVYVHKMLITPTSN
tara:strand:- start:543 stop:1106 length:564 start_codon:yes stop_codon:yes gene_type:complete